MKYYDQDDNELDYNDIDLSLGWIQDELRLVEHHDAVEYKSPEFHEYPGVFYFADGTKYFTEGEDDPHIVNKDGKWGYKVLDNEVEEPLLEVFGIDLYPVQDTEEVPAVDAWDEYEEIGRYYLYTPEQKADHDRRMLEESAKAAFFFNGSGPKRLNNAETAIDDLILTMADMVAG